MKNLFLLPLLALSLSCTPDSDNDEQSTVDCRCATILESERFVIQNQVFSVLTIENDCTGVQRQIERNGVFEVGQKICD